MSTTETAEFPQDSAPLRVYRVLAVDDEEGIVKIIQINLQRAGYEVDTASDGAMALKMLMQNSYDLLISDVMMPQMDGLELLNAVRQDSQLADLPVILLTAKSEDRDITDGYISGTDLYITKPFNPTELITWVNRIVHARQSDDTTDNSGRMVLGNP